MQDFEHFETMHRFTRQFLLLWSTPAVLWGLLLMHGDVVLSFG
jgi:hypothetical protein